MPPYVRHSETSRNAAEKIADKIGELHAKVLEAIRSLGGLTDEEGSAATGLNGNTYRPRRVWLWKNGFIIQTENKRITAAGRNAVVWGAKEDEYD